MEFITDEKLVIIGAAGMIGSNMAQTAAMMHLTPNICLYDTYAPRGRTTGIGNTSCRKITQR